MEPKYITAQDGEERELLRFLEKAFTNFPPRFLKSLPKLYKPEYHPCPQNLIVHEGGQIRAAVGLYPMEFYVGGEKLIAAGIGNVAVGKAWRGEGYMKLLMQQSLELSRERGTDFLALGGQRQRYQYFGFERAGCSCSYHVTQTNLRHARLATTNLTVEPLRPEDAESLKAIHALNEAAPLHCRRDFAALFDILCSWRSVPYILRKAGAFAGYFISGQEIEGISELRLTDPADIGGAVQAILGAAKKDVSFHLDLAETGAAAFFTGLGDSENIGTPGNFHVMNYERVLGAFLRLQARIRPLCEGEIIIRVNGYLEPETLRIRVRDGETSVTPTDDAPAITLEHLAATRCFFAPVSPERNALPAFAAAWFPLPLTFPGADSV